MHRQVSQDLNPMLSDSVVALDTKFYSHMGYPVVDDMLPQRTRSQTTSRYIAVDIQPCPASCRTQRKVNPLMSHTTYPYRSSLAYSCQTLTKQRLLRLSSPQTTSHSCRLRPSVSKDLENLHRTRHLITCRVRVMTLLHQLPMSSPTCTQL